MRTALVYDRVNKWGGAERLLLALNEIFPDAPLYTAVHDPKKAPWAKVFPKVIPSFLQKIPFMQDKHEFLGMLTPIAFESFNLDDYDLVISITSEAGKGILTKPTTRHICICLTPTRYLWSHYDTYFKGLSFKAITKPIISYLRSWDAVAAQRPDIMIAISTEVKDRIYKYYNKKVNIIFPPVDIEKYNTPRTLKTTLLYGNVVKNKAYFLVVSRLVGYKRIDLAVRAFNELGSSLVIVGTGSEEGRLRSIAKQNVIFKGFIEEAEVLALYQNSQALVFPGEEDFGIVMVESLAAGTPVVAYGKGGSLDIVNDGKTGVLFNEQTTEALISAIKRFEIINFNKKELVESVQKFDKQRFQKEILALVNS